jgi:CheY-like chemotaxis protein
MKRLLAVDDHPDSAELIARVAAKCGYDAQPLAKLAPLPALLQDWKPKVITLDLCMPEEDGISVFATLKQAGFDGELIIVSGQDSWLRKTACRLAAAQGLRVVDDLPKPVDLTVLRALLTKLQSDLPAN